MSQKLTNPRTSRPQQQKQSDPLLNGVSQVVIEQQRRSEGPPKVGQIKNPPRLIRESVGVTISSQGVPRRVPNIFSSNH